MTTETICPSAARSFPGMGRKLPISNFGGKITTEKILHAAIGFYNLELIDVLGRSRAGKLCICRFVSYTLMRGHTNATLKDIGDMFGRDHTSIINGLRTLQNLMDVYEDIRRDFKAIEDSIF